MKKIYFSLIGTALLSLTLTGCTVPVGQEEGGMPIIVAVEHSVIHANRDGVDGSEYTVKFAAISANAHTQAIRRESADEYQMSILRKLQNKHYWEVCYGASEPGVIGASYCYYIDSSSHELLTKYNVK